MTKSTILIAASGSGGHLMPAKLIADAVSEIGYRVVFVGSGRPLEQEIFGKTPYTQLSVSMSGVNKLGILGFLKFLVKLPSAIFETSRILRSERPLAIIGVGGYASFLPVVLGALGGIPTWIHEAELHPGTANRVLKFFADKISVAFSETTAFPERKIVFTGHPIRPDVVAIARLEESGPVTPRRVLILGGSQGASSLDNAGMGLASFFAKERLEIFHQCRPENIERVRTAYSEVGLEARVEGFIHELGAAYKWADIIICRAGAGTVMEVGAVNKPTIFVPFPHAQGDHQTKNANTLVQRGKALLVSEGAQFQERLAEKILELKDFANYSKIHSLPRVSRPLDAAKRIAIGIQALVRERGKI